MNTTPISAPPPANAANRHALMTRERWGEVGRIALAGLTALLYWQEVVPIEVLWAAVAIGLYPLVKTDLLDLLR